MPKKEPSKKKKVAKGGTENPFAPIEHGGPFSMCMQAMNKAEALAYKQLSDANKSLLFKASEILKAQGRRDGSGMGRGANRNDSTCPDDGPGFGRGKGQGRGRNRRES